MPVPPSEPRVAPAHTALPQYFNPYLNQHTKAAAAQVLDQEPSNIKIELNHPRQVQSNVDEFLQENHQYL